MPNSSNNFFSSVTLFILVSLLPYMGFAQQPEPKKVTLVITGTVVTDQTPIIQLPANNVPSTVGGKSTLSKSIAKKKPTPITTGKINKAEAMVSNKAAAKKLNNVAITQQVEGSRISTAGIATTLQKKVSSTKTVVPQQTIAANLATTTKPVSASKAIEPVPSAAQSSAAEKASTTKSISPLPSIIAEVKQVEDVTATTIKLGTDSAEILKVTHSSKVNSFRYIWIGVFLFLAGLVLGLLFGKPAFMISFVGVVFIILGLII